MAAAQDIVAFLQERVKVFDPTINVEKGGDFYQKVLLPLAGRMGPDPFTTDVRAFLMDVMARNHPDLASSNLDALAEALVIPMEAMLSPVTAEITRVDRSSSLRYPDRLTVEEAEALGANHLQERSKGQYARGLVQVEFRYPQKKSFPRSVLFSTSSGLSFIPTEDQSISAEEMLLNVTDQGRYYVRVSVIATAPGDQYNIDPRAISLIQGVTGYEAVSNPYKFQFGEPEQTAEEFVDSLPDRTGAKGMTQPAGILSEISASFPVTRVAVVGHGDPEMTRDLLEGGSLGDVLDSGFDGISLQDSVGTLTTRRFDLLDAEEDLLLLGSNLVLTLAHPSFPEKHMDLQVAEILGSTSLRTVESVVPRSLTGIYWTLRRRELLVTDAALLGVSERIAIPPGQVHLGGAVDVYLRGATLDPSTTTIDNLDDEEPELKGVALSGSGSTVVLEDMVRGNTYYSGDATSDLLSKVWPSRWALEILSGPSAGIYEILDVAEVDGGSPTLTLYTELPAATSGARWRILGALNVNLFSPKKLRWEGTDLETTQGLAQVSSTSLVSYLDLGVEEGDVLEILSGPDKGTYQVTGLAGGGNTRMSINTPLTSTASKVPYKVYRESSAAPLDRPMVRLTEVRLLDASGADTGVTVPYGGCLGAISLGVTNPGHGVKLSLPDAQLGIVSLAAPAGFNVSGKKMRLFIEDIGTFTLTFSGSNPLDVDNVAGQINAAVGFLLAVDMGDRVGIPPVGDRQVSLLAPPFPSSYTALFGGELALTTKTIRSPNLTAAVISRLNPALSLDYDVVQFRDGGQVGVHPISRITTAGASPTAPGLLDPDGLVGDLEGGFLPEVDVRMDVGARSVGTMRCYFTDPVTVEFGQSAVLRYGEGTSQDASYRPDPFFETVILPGGPAGSKPHDGNCIGGDNVFNTSLDLREKQIRPGDLLVVDYLPLRTSVLADTIVNLAGKTLILSYGAEAQQVLTFVHDSGSVPSTDVTREGALLQIQRFLGSSASLQADNRFRLDPEYLLVLGKGGTANTYLGFSTSADTSNLSANAGTYTVVLPGNLGCTVAEVLPAAEADIQFSIRRRGAQRQGATQMSTSVDPSGLYFFDVEVVSEGTGDSYNLANGELLDVTGHLYEGYTLRSVDPRYALSVEEEVWLELPRRIIPVGSNDDPSNAVYLQGGQVQITADTAGIVREVQSFLLDDANRDVCASPLAIALTPHFVYLFAEYIGGESPTGVKSSLERMIHAIFPEQYLSVDDLIARMKQEGAGSLRLPLSLFAVVMGRDRKMRLQASQDRLGIGAQSAFYPEKITLLRRRG